MAHITQSDLAATLPDVTSTLVLAELDGPITIIRDALGIPRPPMTPSWAKGSSSRRTDCGRWISIDSKPTVAPLKSSVHPLSTLIR